MSDDLAFKKCKACERGTLPMAGEEVIPYLILVPEWCLVENNKIQRKIKFRNFSELMKFVSRMAELAEGEGHHPDFSVTYNRLAIILWTHAIYGLSENDFIMASKIDRLLKDFFTA